MSQVTIHTRSGGSAAVPGGAVSALGDALSGSLIRPGEAGYDEARAVWNAMIDRRPALVARCANAADVQAAVRFARDHDLLVSIKGAGHNIAGNAVCENGLLIDLSGMRSVELDGRRRRAHVAPGCTLGDVDAATQKEGLAVPTGINSTTGIAGLTLGGGFGWLTRKHGLTVDSLLSADVVTADGELIRASADENADLFWGLRGGGGNFGVVTSFEFALHPVGPEVLSGLIVHPFDDADDVLRAYRDFVADAPEELTVWVVVRKAPPLPFLPEEWHGREVVVLAACYAGDMAEGEKALAPLRAVGRPIADVISPHPFAGWQQAFDPLLTPGARNYWKSHDFDALEDGLLDTALEHASRLPSPHCEVFIAHVGGGAASRVPEDATAYPSRGVEFIMNVHGRWEDAIQDEAGMGWARGLFHAVEPYARGSVYVNFMTADESDRVAAAYGSNYARLADLKRRVDPGNLFRMNQNIRPAARA